MIFSNIKESIVKSRKIRVTYYLMPKMPRSLLPQSLLGAAGEAFYLFIVRSEH